VVPGLDAAVTVTAHVLETRVPLIVALAVNVAEPAAMPVMVMFEPLLALVELIFATEELLVDHVIADESLEVALMVAVLPTTNDLLVAEIAIEAGLEAAVTVTAHVLVTTVPLIVALAVNVAEPAETPVIVIFEPLLALVELMLATEELLVDQVILEALLEVALIVVVLPTTNDLLVAEIAIEAGFEVPPPQIASA